MRAFQEMMSGRAGPVVVGRDEHPRPDTTLEGLAKSNSAYLIVLLKPFADRTEADVVGRDAHTLDTERGRRT